MTRAERMREKLTATFAPERLDIIDESEAHRGHSGFQEGGESHFRVAITAKAFAEMPRLARHRAVHAALGAELMAEIHALALEIEAL
ncbi:MAG: BolA family protein [Pseudomonadota bacterium]